MKLLAIGDLHLGRPPAALPAALGGEAAGLGPETAWNRAVDRAISLQVQAVLLAGDVVDRNRDFFVAYQALKHGVQRLAGAGIRVLAVAGNHDTEVLPRLADEVKDLHLLGRGGRWELRELDGVAVLGWSFPDSRVRTSPLASLEIPATRLPVIGLLHCDRDAVNSPYAPVSGSELEAAGTAAWLLGHIHQPDDLTGSRPLGYLGSMTALRASETGPRGPWLVEVDGSRIQASHLPLAPLGYAELEVPVESLDEPGALPGAVLTAARDCLHAWSAGPDGGELPDVLGLRIVLTGATGHGPALAEAAAEMVAQGAVFEESGVRLFVQKAESLTTPSVDLQVLAENPDPAGLLARRLLALGDPRAPERAELVERARARMQEIADYREFQALAETPDETTVVRLLERAGRAALTRLLEQKQTRETGE